MLVGSKVVKFLARQRSASSSSDSELKDSDIGGADPETDSGAQPAALQDTGLTRIYLDACKYGEVLEEGDDAPPDGAEELVPPQRKGDEDDDAQSIRRFANLVGRDLSQPDLAASNRIAKINANNWLKTGDGLGNVVSAEPDLMDAAKNKEPEPLADDEKREDSTPVQTEAHHRPFPSRGESISKLSPEQIVKLLIEEFGSLSTSNADEERLLSEMDGAYFQDIAIIGMIHLTTHRLTFHASLLSTRPDLLPDMQIIKQGPVTHHRPGFHGYDRKRRVWLELSHDMLTIFPSGKEEDRIKPIQSMLCTCTLSHTVNQANRPYPCSVLDQRCSSGRSRESNICTNTFK